jgi:hypothetical protein
MIAEVTAHSGAIVVWRAGKLWSLRWRVGMNRSAARMHSSLCSIDVWWVRQA